MSDARSMSPAEFSREIEAYLCRKNDGHLIRIVGPVFEKVCGWAAQGVPLRVAFQGIDRYFERRLAKGPAANRRPARAEFCEPDILDAFDAWRRAVGVAPGMVHDDGDAAAAHAAGGGDAPAAAPAQAGVGVRDGVGADADAQARFAGGGDARAGMPPAADAGASSERGTSARRKTGLQTHIDRVMARLTQRRVDAGVSSTLGDAIDRLLAELDTLRGGAKGARQDARADLEARLRSLDETLVSAARASIDASLWQAATRDAREELEPFRARMVSAAYDAALQAATTRGFRALARLPTVAVED